MSDEPWWNKWPAWLDEDDTSPVCGRCATELGWIDLHYHNIKLNCFVCENKKTNNRVPQWIINETKRVTRLSRELSGNP